MDTTPATAERELLEAALATLAGWGLAPEIVAIGPAAEWGRAGALIRLQLGKRTVVRAVEVKRGLRPGTLTFYGPRVEPRLVLEQRLKPRTAGNVEFLRRFWAFGDDPPGLAPDVLVYADLVATGDARCLEAARQLEGGIRARLGR